MTAPLPRRLPGASGRVAPPTRMPGGNGFRVPGGARHAGLPDPEPPHVRALLLAAHQAAELDAAEADNARLLRELEAERQHVRDCHAAVQRAWELSQRWALGALRLDSQHDPDGAGWLRMASAELQDAVTGSHPVWLDTTPLDMGDFIP